MSVDVIRRGCTSRVIPRSDQIRSVQTYNTRLNVCFNAKTVLTFVGHVRLSHKKRSTGSPERLRSFLAKLGPAWRETAGFTRRTHPRRNSGPKRPSAFPAWREPPIVRLMTPCFGGCALTYASARGVLAVTRRRTPYAVSVLMVAVGVSLLMTVGVGAPDHQA